MSKKTITLRSSDGELFEVEEAIAHQSRVIKNILDEDDCEKKEYPLENVRAEILAKVIDYCKKHHVDGASSSSCSSSSSYVDLKKWDADFIDVDKSTIYELILAANYLSIKSLLDLTCQTVADMIKGKTPDQIRAHFNLENDFTPEEEDEIRMENKWVFE